MTIDQALQPRDGGVGNLVEVHDDRTGVAELGSGDVAAMIKWAEVAVEFGDIGARTLIRDAEVVGSLAVPLGQAPQPGGFPRVVFGGVAAEVNLGAVAAVEHHDVRVVLTLLLDSLGFGLRCGGIVSFGCC